MESLSSLNGLTELLGCPALAGHCLRATHALALEALGREHAYVYAAGYTLRTVAIALKHDIVSALGTTIRDRLATKEPHPHLSYNKIEHIDRP